MLTNKALVPLITILFFLSCTDEIETDSGHIDSNNQNLYIEYLEARGFATESIIFRERELVVEGDIIFLYADLNEILGIHKKGNRKHDIKVDHRGIAKENYLIHYFVEPTLIAWEDHIEEDIENAFKSWLDHAELDYLRVYYRTAADIVIKDIFDADPASPYGEAGGTSAGEPGSSIRINTAKNMCRHTRQSLFAHEIGHTIGFGHSNSSIGTTVGCLTVPTGCNGSLMADGCGFPCNTNIPTTPTNNEIQAIKMLYPPLVAYIEASFGGYTPDNSQMIFNIQPITYSPTKPAKVMVKTYISATGTLLRTDRVYCGPNLTNGAKKVYIPKTSPGLREYEVMYSNIHEDCTTSSSRIILFVP